MKPDRSPLPAGSQAPAPESEAAPAAGRRNLAGAFLALSLALLPACDRARESGENPVPPDLQGDPIEVDRNTPQVAQAIAEPLPAPTPAGTPEPPSTSAAPDITSNIPTESEAESGIETVPGPDGFVTVGFHQLAGFDYEVPELKPMDQIDAESSLPDASPYITPPDTAQIPKEIRQLDNRKVAIEGFMLPLKVEQGKVTELLLMRDQSMCCFGTTPKITEWITVRASPGVDALMDIPVKLAGTLHVGEVFENGYLVGIYEMEGDRLVSN